MEKKIKLRKNLAESFYAAKKFDKATEHYLWIVKNSDHWQDAQLRAIAARYETLKLPKKITPNPENKIDELNALEPRFVEWVSWIDQLDQDKKSKDLAPFLMKANQSIYAFGAVDIALKRLMTTALRYPTLQKASVNLILDTKIKREQWADIYALTQEIETKDKDLSNRLDKLKAQSSEKIIFTAFEEKNYKLVVELSKNFQSKSDVVKLLKAKALVEQKEIDDAIDILKKTNSNEGKITLAGIYIDELDYKKAVQTLKLAKLDSNQESQAKNLAWLTQQTWPSKDPEYDALINIYTPKTNSKTLTREAIRSKGAKRVYLAMAALNQHEKLTFPDRNVLINIIASGWNKLDDEKKLAFTPLLIKKVPEALSFNRKAIQKYASDLERKIMLMEEMEGAATRAIKKFNWARLKVSTLEQIALMYFDLLAELNPNEHKDLISPIKEKAIALENEVKKLVKASSIASNDAITYLNKEHLKEHLFAKNHIQIQSLIQLLDDDKDNKLLKLWKSAIENNQIALAAHYSSKLDEKHRAITLIAAGAQSEGMKLYQKSKLISKEKFFLLAHHIHSLNKDSIEDTLDKIKIEEVDTPIEAYLFLVGNRIINEKLSAKDRYKLLNLAKDSKQSEIKSWAKKQSHDSKIIATSAALQ